MFYDNFSNQYALTEKQHRQYIFADITDNISRLWH